MGSGDPPDDGTLDACDPPRPADDGQEPRSARAATEAVASAGAGETVEIEVEDGVLHIRVPLGLVRWQGAPFSPGGEISFGGPAGAPVGAPPVGLAVVAADPFAAGFARFRIRADLTGSYLAAREQVRTLGGFLPSSGGIRDLDAPVTAGRSRTSLHYTGRALDLFVAAGMQSVADPFVITVDGDAETRPQWRVWCESTGGEAMSPLFRPDRLFEGTLAGVLWRPSIGLVAAPRQGRFVAVTEVMADHGWLPIPARSDWKQNYMSCEWWHFQNQAGLVEGVTTLGAELRAVWPAATVAASGLALDAVWRGRGFVER